MQLATIVDGMFTLEPLPRDDGLVINGTFADLSSVGDIFCFNGH